MSGNTVCSHGTNTDSHCILCCKKQDCKMCEAKLNSLSKKQVREINDQTYKNNKQLITALKRG